MQSKIFLALLITFGMNSSPAIADPEKKTIRTYKDFENSYLYRELSFSNLKNPPGYRVYKDQNNNYVVALQIDDSGAILTERIMPLPKVGSKEQNAGMSFFVMDFIFGDGATIKDIRAANELVPKIGAMSTPTGTQIGQFKVCLAQDPWKIRAGLDVKTPNAKPWGLAFLTPAALNPNAADTSSTSTTASLPNTVGTNSNSAELAGLRTELKQALKKVLSLERQLNSTKASLSNTVASLEAAKRETQVARVKAISQYSEQVKKLTFERDDALDKIRNLEDEQKAMLARFGNASTPSISTSTDTFSVRTDTLPFQSTAPTVNEPASDELIQVQGFKTKFYRRNVERHIWQSMHALTPPTVLAATKVRVTFDVMADGSPENIDVTLIEPKADEQLIQQIQQRARHVILSAAPYQPFSHLNISSLRLSVDLEQLIQSDSYSYKVFAQFAEKPSFVSSVPSDQRSVGK